MPGVERSFVFGYAHMLLFASITATGVGLRVYAFYLEGQSKIGEAAVVASVAIPVAVFAIVLTFLHAYMVAVDPLQMWLAAAVLVCSAAAIVLAMARFPLTICLALILATPAATIILDELIGHRSRAKALGRLTGG